MKITYFGHSAFRIDTGSSVILIDPFLSGNPHFKGDIDSAVAGVTHIVLSHGHFDHVGDTVDIAKKHGCKVVGTFELVSWLGKKGKQYLNGTKEQGSAPYCFPFLPSQLTSSKVPTTLQPCFLAMSTVSPT